MIKCYEYGKMINEERRMVQIWKICTTILAENNLKNYWLPTNIKYQFYLIARNDDMAHLIADNILMLFLPNIKQQFFK